MRVFHKSTKGDESPVRRKFPFSIGRNDKRSFVVQVVDGLKNAILDVSPMHKCGNFQYRCQFPAGHRKLASAALAMLSTFNTLFAEPTDAMNNILVEGCTFGNPRGYIFAARNGSDMIFRRNKIVWTDPLYEILPYSGKTLLEGGKNNTIEKTNTMLRLPAADVMVEAGGEKFVVRGSDGRIFRIVGGKRQRVFTRTLRVKTPSVSGQVSTAGILSKLSVKEVFPSFTIVRGEYSLSVKEPGKGENAPFDGARLEVEYLFRKDLPGFVATETLVADKPFFFGGWSVLLAPPIARFAKDGEDFRAYPTRKELKSAVGGYRTNAAKYIIGEEPDGTKWWMGREFSAFEPRGDGKPGSFRAGPIGEAARKKPFEKGDKVSVSVAAGIVKSQDDIENLRAQRAMQPGFLGLAAVFEPEEQDAPPHDELARRIAEIAAANAALPDDTGDEYLDVMKAMTDYFLDFMKSDLAAEKTIAFGSRRKEIDARYRRYMDGRIDKNSRELISLHKELAERAAALRARKISPVKTVKYRRGVRPEIRDGGFQIDGKEILLIGPDTWMNVKGWRNSDIDVIAKMGFNLVDCFYVGGTNYADIVRRCETNGIWCIWGSALDTGKESDEFLSGVGEMSEEKQNAYRSGKGYWKGSLVPTNPSPAFVYQVSFPEQWNRRREGTPEWAEEFRSCLKGQCLDFPADIDFAAALKDSPLKYESFRFRLRENLKKAIPVQKRLEERFGLPRSTHFSSYYNLCGLDPLVTLADFEAHWGMFDIVGFDGGFGLESAEFAIDFAKGGIELDMARSFYPGKPVANNENHVIIDGIYRDYDEKAIYLTNILCYLLGQNAGSIWNWANTRHTYGEYAFTRVNTCAATIRAALDIRRFPEEVAAMRRTGNPPFRILHSLPSMQNESYVRSLYGIYAASSFTGWPVRFLSERDLARGDFKGAKIVVVPDARCVSDTTFAALDTFARGGGVVIADGEKALMSDEWGRPVPPRAETAERFRKISDQGSRTRFGVLADALDETGARPPLALSCADGSRPYGVIWRTGKTAAGDMVSFVANLRRGAVSLECHGEWCDLLKGRRISGVFTLAPCETVLLAEMNRKGER